jgi:hypothetical protein
MLVAGVTAALVFIIGRALLPLPPKSPPPTAATLSPLPPLTNPTNPTNPIDAMDGVDGAARIDGASIDEGGLGRAEPLLDAGREPSPLAAADNGSGTSASRTAPDGPQVDKDIARAAWRANWPDVRVVGPRASLIIPIKGSAEGGSYHVSARTRTLVVTLPHAASLNTMRFYRLDQDGFRALWIVQDENNALPAAGTKLRLTLGVASIPQVELYDDFVKISVRSPLEPGGK